MISSGILQYLSGTDADWSVEDYEIPFGFFVHNSSSGEWRLGNNAPYTQSPLLVAPITVIKLAAPFSISVTARSNVPGWEFPVIENKFYRIQVIATHQTAATTTGGSLGVILSSGAGSIVGKMNAAISAASVATELATPITTIGSTAVAGSFLTSSGVSVINTPHFFLADLFFFCTQSGTFLFRWGSEVGSSAAQLNANSTLLITQFI